jgi:hypothetical protein
MDRRHLSEIVGEEGGDHQLQEHTGAGARAHELDHEFYSTSCHSAKSLKPSTSVETIRGYYIRWCQMRDSRIGRAPHTQELLCFRLFIFNVHS